MPGEVIDGKRVCPGCKLDKPLGDYTPRTTGRCKKCLAAAAADRYEPVPQLPLPELFCLQCGTMFRPRSTRVFMCSDACTVSRKAAMDQYYKLRDPDSASASKRAWERRNPDKKADQSRKYRARKMGATIEKFSRAEVLERDGWLCGICGGSIDKDERFPSGGSASLDHIIPLSRGGSHSLDNSQAAHLTCNIRKGARMA